MMMRCLGTLALVMTVGVGQSWSAETLVFSPKQSKIDFVGKKADGKHVGGFKTFQAKAVADHDDPSGSSLEIVIDTSSLWSDNDKLTNHLKNPDFFDVRKHPKITFTTTKIAPAGEGKADITGDLMMLGKTVSVTVPAEVEVSDDQVKLKASFKIDRAKWGMEYGKGNIENDAAISAELVFAR